MPLSLFDKPKFKGVQKLFAANGTEIHVARAHTLQVDFNLHKKFSWNFTVADISTPILGTQFFKAKWQMTFYLIYWANVLFIASLFAVQLVTFVYVTTKRPYDFWKTKSGSANSGFTQTVSIAESTASVATYLAPLNKFLKGHEQKKRT